MKTVKCFAVFLLFGALLVNAAVYRPRFGQSAPMNLRRLHHRSAMYYHPEMMYIPSMTSFTSGDAFTGYLQPDSQTVPQDKPCQNCNSIPEEPEPQPEPEQEPVPLPEYEETTRVHKVEIELPLEEETAVGVATQVPVIEEVTTQKTKTKVVPKKPLPEEEDEEDDYEDWPYVKQQGRKVPPYNVFFPMMFGGYPGNGRSGQGYPGAATAIANAFSSGKGGIATSHATAFGNAPPLNKSQWNKRSQNHE